MKTTFSLRVCALMTAAWFAAPYSGAIEAFLWVDGIPGDVTNEQHNGWIELVGMTNRAERLSSAQSLVDATDWIVLKRVDKATPLLYKTCAQAQPVARALIDLVLGEPTNLRFYQIILSNVVVLSISSSASVAGIDARGASVEQVRLRPQWAGWSYTVFHPQSGLPQTQISAFWDQVRKIGGSANHKSLFTVSGIQKDREQMVLSWPARAGQSYRIFSSGNLLGTYRPLTEVTALHDGPMTYSTPCVGPIRFFVVEQR